MPNIEPVGRVLAAKGADPSAERHAARPAMTLAELCDLYLAEAAGQVTASTLAMDRSRIEQLVKLPLGRHAVRSITPEDVRRRYLSSSRQDSVAAAN